MLLIGNARLITWNDETPFIDGGCVAVSGGDIDAFGPTANLRAQYPNAEFYDAAGRIVMPGLICAHTHIYSAFARGLSLPQKSPNKNFTDILENVWWRIDKALNTEDNIYSAYAIGLESVRNGVTCLFDHHASPYHAEGSLFAIDGALAEIGLRRSLCYEVSDRDGAEICDRAIRENIAFIDHAAADTSGMVSGMFGLHASFTLSERTLERCIAAMGARRAGYHIHAAEGIYDVYDSLAKYGKRVIERLNDAGILGEKTLAVHCIHINSAETDILKASGAMAVHNPQSNMGNAVGCSAALHMLKKGILLGLGTDAYTHDMFECLKTANLIHRHHLHNPSVGFAESLEMLFKNNAAICSRFFKKPLGIIKQGAAADLIVLGYTPHTPLNGDTAAGHIMFGLSGRCVDSTVINGRFIMKERVISTVDEAAILSGAQRQSADFWRRVSV